MNRRRATKQTVELYENTIKAKVGTMKWIGEIKKISKIYSQEDVRILRFRLSFLVRKLQVGPRGKTKEKFT